MRTATTLKTVGATLALALLALPTQARDFSIHEVIGRTPRQVDRAIGKPLSIGEGGTFREYGTKRSGWYVRFSEGKSVMATVTFRAPFATPAAALEAIGLEPGKKGPAKKTFLTRRWERLEGIKSVTVRSLDGKRWDTIEIQK